MITEAMLEDYHWIFEKDFMWTMEKVDNFSPRPHQPCVVWNHYKFKDFLEKVEKIANLME